MLDEFYDPALRKYTVNEFFDLLIDLLAWQWITVPRCPQDGFNDQE